MIKVAVTHLKAPWPAGVIIGSVVALATAAVPGWAAGKCAPLAPDDEREAEFSWTPPQIDHSDPQERTFVVNPAAVAEQLQEHASRIAELGQQLLDAEQALGTARAEIGSLGAQLAAAQAGLLDASQQRDTAAAEREKALADLAAATAPKAAKKAAAA